MSKKPAFTLAEVLIPKRVSEIKNKVFNSRASEIKEPFNLNKKLLAFTLAEVLITLAIIGVVAALTIPTVVAKYQKKAYYTQFMKVYNTLSEALSLTQVDNGPYESWAGPQVVGATSGNYFVDRSESIKSNFLSNLKIAKICESASDCGVSDDMTFSSLNYSDGDDNLYEDAFFVYDSEEDGEGLFTFLLSDGALVALHYNDRLASFEFIIDSNGIKGPNILGRDIFILTTIDKNGTQVLAPNGVPYAEFTMEKFESDDRFNCTTKYKCSGEYCAARLLLEGKMNY